MISIFLKDGYILVYIKHEKDKMLIIVVIFEQWNKVIVIFLFGFSVTLKYSILSMIFIQ